MQFGLIGFGAWGKLHAQAIRKAPGAELAAIACASEASAQAAREAYPQARVGWDWRALIAVLSLEAVDIVVPNHLHAEMAIAALDAGKDVLLEKPMASTIVECEQILAAVRRTGRVLSVGHEFRISTQWGFIKRLIEAGEIGDLLYANVSLFRFPYRQGSGGWRYGRDTVGSWILEEPVHFFDMLMWWFAGVGDPASVQAFGNSKGRGADLVVRHHGSHADAKARAEGAEEGSERLRDRRARAVRRGVRARGTACARRRGLPPTATAGLGRGGAQDRDGLPRGRAGRRGRDGDRAQVLVWLWSLNRLWSGTPCPFSIRLSRSAMMLSYRP